MAPVRFGLPSLEAPPAPVPPPTRPHHDWSSQQLAIFDWFARGTGNLVVRARAGAAKTSSALEGIEHAPDDSILMAAFNKRIAEELQARLTNPRAEAMTLHSAGFRILRSYWRGVRIAERQERADGLAIRACEEPQPTRGVPDGIVRAVSKLHTIAREVVPFAKSGDDLVDLAWAFDCNPPETMALLGWDLAAVCRAAYRAMELAKRRLQPGEGIDFTDMIYLPVVNGWIRPTYDLVVIDECQDMNATQIELARRLAISRVCVIGDDRQAIYGWRGADSGSLDRLKKELDAQELGLNTTYRCGKSIVAVAQRYVPDFQAGPTNPQGLVRDVQGTDALMSEVRAGDAILSRLNAPLVSLCLKLLKLGTPARIEGRDVAAGLRAVLKELAVGRAATSVPELLAKVRRWEDREVARAMRGVTSASSERVKARAELVVEAVRDKASALLALCDGAMGVQEVRGRIETVFADTRPGERERCVTLSTVHRAKGLEWRRVYLLADTFTREGGEEDNIRYVAVTRAKEELVWVK